MIRPYKFIVQAVVQEVEDDVVVGERTTEPAIVFGTEALEAWAQEFTDKLATME